MPHTEKIQVYLTVDTEHSIGGAFSNALLKPVNSTKRIFGQIGRKYYGIPLISDIADRYGLKLIFFLELLNKYWFGENESRQVCDYILKRGHEVQAHVHPNYLNFTTDRPEKLIYSDFMSAYPMERQVELLTEARGLLHRYGATNPNAFRAGCFGAGQSTLIAAAKAGFLIDSSYNRSYCGKTCALPDLEINDLTEMEGIFEFPITNFIEHSYARSTRFMPLDINGVSFQEIKQALEDSIHHGPGHITILLHSFSFIKALDVQYVRAKPRGGVILRFEKLCRFLSENKESFDVSTFQHFSRMDLLKRSSASRHWFTKMPAVVSLGRGIEQAADRFS